MQGREKNPQLFHGSPGRPLFFILSAGAGKKAYQLVIIRFGFVVVGLRVNIQFGAEQEPELVEGVDAVEMCIRDSVLAGR